MKTTVDIHDDLLTRAKRHARGTGRSLRAVVEDGLRRVLSSPAPGRRYRLADLRAGNLGTTVPIDAYSWSELHEPIYDDRGAR